MTQSRPPVTPTLQLSDAFVRINGLIVFGDAIAAAAPRLCGHELFLGYEATGFGAASILALLTGRRAGLLRAQTKSYGLQRLIETGRDERRAATCLVHAGDVSAAARAAIADLPVHALRLGEADLRGHQARPDWAIAPCAPKPAASQRSATLPRPTTFEREQGYVLSSGITRPTYVDVFSTLLDPHVSLAYAASAGADITSYDSIIGMANGGIFFATALALAAGKPPMAMDHGKTDLSPVPSTLALGRSLLVDESVGSGDYFRIATAKLAGVSSSIDYLAAVRFAHRGEYEFPIMFGAVI